MSSPKLQRIEFEKQLDNEAERIQLLLLMQKEVLLPIKSKQYINPKVPIRITQNKSATKKPVYRSKQAFNIES